MADPTAASVKDQLADNNDLVRKHGTQLMAIADYGTPVPDAWYEDVTGEDTVKRRLPKLLPEGYRNMGYITTDGIQNSTDVSTSDVTAVQSLTPVRTDVDGLTDTLQVAFLEASGWTHALAAGLPVAEWPEDKAGEWEFHDGDKEDFPEYRILILTQDKAGDKRWFRLEYAYKAVVTDIADRSLQRSDAETIGRTFTCFVDDAVGRSKTRKAWPILTPSAAGARVASASKATSSDS
jgi:hypothetical protein